MLFDVGKSKLKPEARQELDVMAGQISDIGDGNAVQLIVEGHTDSRGTYEGNKRLSNERATAVWEALATKVDIGQERVTVRGRGEARPVAANDTEEGRALNRRVDILVLLGSK